VHLKISETEKSARQLRDISESFFPMGRGEGISKIYSLLVSEEGAQFMNAILDTMAGLKYKHQHESFLFGLRILFYVLLGLGVG